MENRQNSTNINWFPGHMAKTRRLIKEKYDLIDVVYEVIDSRMPLSSKIVDIDDLLKDKALSNAIEAKSRGAKLTILTTEDMEIDEGLFDSIIRVPKVNEFYQALINIVPFQLLAYEVAKERGCDIDKPKNLAKSVTVE